VVRARDGAVVLEGLGDIWYTGPVASGADVWWVGSKGDSGRSDNSRAWGWTLRSNGAGGLTASPKFSRSLADSERIYAAPLVHGGLLYVVSRRNHLQVLDARTGADVYDRKLDGVLVGDGYQSISAVRGSILLGCATADFLVLRAGRTFEQVALNDLPGSALATPVFVGGVAYVRGAETLYGFNR
jgi:outer membrane protein assembly factor BamB